MSSVINQVRGDTKAAGEMFESMVSGYSSEAHRFAIDLARARFRKCQGTILVRALDAYFALLAKCDSIAGMVMCLQFTQTARTSAVLLKKSTPRRLWNGSGTYANAPLCIEVK